MLNNNAKQYARRVHSPQLQAISLNGPNVRYIVVNLTSAELEIKRLGREVKGVR